MPRHYRIAVWAGAACLTLLTHPAPSRANEPGRIAFDHIAPEGVEDIWSIRPDGSDLTKITTTPAGQGGSEAPEWGPFGRRVLFDSDRAGSVHLFAADPDGTHIRQLTHSDGLEYFPGVSPDGRTIAFEHDAGDFSASGIYLIDRPGGDFATARQITVCPVPATAGFDTDPEFSPDGKTIAFLRVLSLVAPTAESAVFVIGRDGRGLKQLTPYSLNARAPRWSPDGRRLLFSSNDDNNDFDHPADLYVVNADGRGLTQLTHEPLGSNAFTPDWSPDGTQIAYTHYSPAEGAVVSIMDLASRGTHVIWHSSPHTVDWDLAWEHEPRRREASAGAWW